MNLNKKFLSLMILSSVTSLTFADDLPAKIVQEPKAIVPVTKTQVITTVDGQNPVRKTDTTVLDVQNKGKDIVAHDITTVDDKDHFSKKPLAKPIVKHKSVTVPTSKIEEKTTITQDGKVVAVKKKVDVHGVKYEKGHKPQRKSLHVKQVKAPHKGSVTRAVVGTNGEKTKDVTVVAPEQ